MAEEESQEVDSSPPSEEQQVDESTTEQVAEDTVSPSDTTEVEAEKTQTLAEAVQDAFQPPDEVEAETTEETTEVAEPIESSEETPSDDYKDIPFNKHPRFRKLVAEKNELKETAAKLQNDSEQYSKITGFIDRNNLTAKDAVEGFKIMAAIRNDPNQAYKMLDHHLNNVSKITGRVLPDDIQAKVDDGFIDEDAAKELSQARASLVREQALRKQDAAKNEGRNMKTQSDIMGTALQSWGETTLAKDPDFSLKQEEFNDRVVALVSERGRPNNQTEVMSIVEDAYETVNDRFKARQPQPTQLRTATGGKLSGAPRTEAKSLSDAITMAYENS
tara:strand:- start:243 stop:1238 length:996 start_codon:yes stop_codon:yes gene_type:complete